MADVEQAVEEMMEAVSEIGDNTNKFSQGESAEFFEAIAHDCMERCRTIRSEMEQAQMG